MAGVAIENEILSQPLIFNSCFYRALGNGQVFIASDFNLRGVVLRQQVASFFLSFKNFNSIEKKYKEHLKQLNSRKKIIFIADILQTGFELQQSVKIFDKPILNSLLVTASWLIENEILLTKKRGLEIISQTAAQISQNNKQDRKITNVSIVTCNRADSLFNCLTSYSKNIDTFRSHVKILVVDDSRDVDVVKKNSEVVSLVRSSSRSQILHIDLKAKTNFIRHLTKKGFSEEILNFGLLDSIDSKYSFGANTNWHLLLSAGQLAFATDDDTICRPHRIDEFASQIKVGTQNSYVNIKSFNSRESALRNISEQSYDFLSQHEIFLGKTVSQIIDSQMKSKGSLDLSDFDSGYLRLDQLESQKVLLTLNSLVGDSGSNSTFHLLFYKKDQSDSIFKNKDLFQQAMAIRENAKYPMANLIVPAHMCMSTFYGYDNTDVLPPFFPYFRDSDSLFSRMLGLTLKGSQVAYLPEFLYHNPPEYRSYNQSSLSVEFQEIASITNCIRYLFSYGKINSASNAPTAMIKKMGELCRGLKCCRH